MWGRRPVAEALSASRPIRRILIARGSAQSARSAREQAAAAGVPVAYVDRAEIDALAFGGNHQGVAAVLDGPQRPSLDALLRDDAHLARPPLMLAADRVQDVGNLGSLVRTLEAVGGAGLVVPTRRSAALTGGLARASAGASLRVPIVPVANLARALDRLKSLGVLIVGLEADGSTTFDRPDYHRPCCLVVGNEAEGLRPRTRDICDTVVRVPMHGAVGSLNVAVAGGLVLYHVVRARAEGTSHDA